MHSGILVFPRDANRTEARWSARCLECGRVAPRMMTIQQGGPRRSRVRRCSSCAGQQVRHIHLQAYGHGGCQQRARRPRYGYGALIYQRLRHPDGNGGRLEEQILQEKVPQPALAKCRQERNFYQLCGDRRRFSHRGVDVSTPLRKAAGVPNV